ncbi:MAG: anaerobic ribonucleoside-triphosphate reductase activating protein [Rikenellaceae bacterium]|jgi:anaerobic ribonucleoside-triphosphate reductase activating protein|nr:anaerobic ribonucleoside-triphosphate reductase activating protein [Rikenellaceae bacterium]
MLRLASYDMVFREVPGEVTLALNIAGCPNRCPGCHSPHLQEETGELLDDALLAGLLDRYGVAATCVCLMGGDVDPAEVARLAVLVRSTAGGRLKTGWYSGRAVLPEAFPLSDFNFIKLGPYVKALGGLDRESTNQRFYRVEDGKLIDLTATFRKKPFSDNA